MAQVFLTSVQLSPLRQLIDARSLWSTEVHNNLKVMRIQAAWRNQPMANSGPRLAHDDAISWIVNPEWTREPGSNVRGPQLLRGWGTTLALFKRKKRSGRSFCSLTIASKSRFVAAIKTRASPERARASQPPTLFHPREESRRKIGISSTRAAIPSTLQSTYKGHQQSSR